MKYILSKLLFKIMLMYGNLLIHLKGWSIFDDYDKWDIVFLLDGCRYDTFEKVNKFDGYLQSKISMGSCTPEWAQASLGSIRRDDLVYISANPYISSFYLKKWKKNKLFFHLEPLWDKGWNKELKTVPPKVVIDSFKKLLKKYPNKKFFIHLMQPHHPFIGKKTNSIGGWEASRDIIKGKSSLKYKNNVYDLFKNGLITKKEIVSAYEDNLKLAFFEIEKIIPKLKNKRVIFTSDHGNLFGEYGLSSHPSKTNVPELIKVPYFKLKV